MAKDKKKAGVNGKGGGNGKGPGNGAGNDATAAVGVGATGVIEPEQAAGGQHHAASAHGRPARIDKSLPADRDQLIALHGEARRRRANAALGSEAYRAAVDEIARIEIRIADIDRAADPPRG